MTLCVCPPATRRFANEPLICGACGGWIPRGRPLTIGQAGAIKRDCESLLAKVAEDYPWVLGFCWDAPRRGERIGSSSGPSDPTGTVASSEQRLRIAASVALSGRFLERAVLFLRLADEALGDASYVADPRPPERAQGTWYPMVAVPDEIEAARLALAKRRARGEIV